MKNTKRIFLSLLSICTTAWCSLNAMPQQESVDNRKPLKIVFDNDVHGSIDRYAYLAGFRDALERKGYPVLTVSVGDYLQGSSYATVSQGQFCIDMMNATRYDVVAVGNHDIDYGVNRLLTLRDSLQRCAMVCCNLYDKDNRPCLPAFTILKKGGYKVAFVGVLTTATELLQANVVFDREGHRLCSFAQDSLVQVVQKNIDLARSYKPDWVVLLTHMGEDPLNQHMASWQLVEQLTGVDAVIDGHSHSVVNTTIYQAASDKKVLVAQTGFGMKNIGCLTLEREANPKVQLYACQNLQVSEQVHAFYQQVENKMEPILGQVIGYTPFDLQQTVAGQRLVRRQETNLGDLVADAYRLSLGTDIGWVNGGGIRHGIDMGDITYGQMLSVSPFFNFMCIAQVSGQMVADALEECYHTCPTDLGSFAQISGLRCQIDTAIHNSLSWNTENTLIVRGERRVKHIEVYKDGAWRPLDKDEQLTIGSSNYVLYDGELQSLKKAKRLKDKVMTDTECLQNYITKTLQGVIPDTYRQTQGRISIK